MSKVVNQPKTFKDSLKTVSLGCGVLSLIALIIASFLGNMILITNSVTASVVFFLVWWLTIGEKN